MPCLAGKFDPAIGPIIQVAIINLDHVPDLSKSEISSSLNIFNALIDTGATTTCISEKVIADCELVPTGKTLMMSATGDMAVDQFTFGVGFMVGEMSMPTGEVQGNLFMKPVLGCQFQKGQAPFEILLGRDIICSGSFTLSFDGHFILSI